MKNMDIQPLLITYHRRLQVVDTKFKRSLYSRINWNVRLIGIRGARGVGKTTMLLQRIKEAFPRFNEAMYVSLDNLWFSNNSLEDLVEYLYTHGVHNIFLDEVHKYPNWSAHLKNFYDNYPDLNIVYTGSAMLAIDNSKVDLSRRQSLYTLKGLSFREYLEYEFGVKHEIIKFQDLLENHTTQAMRITSQCKILKQFENYLKHGYYPYYKEVGEDYYQRVEEVINLVIESDMPVAADVTFSTIQKIKKLLMVITQNVPLEPNIAKLTAQLETTRDQCLKMLYLLDKADLLYLLTDKLKDYKHLNNPKKIYLNNTNLMYALSANVSEGNLRETFFANQLTSIGSVVMPRQGDFFIDDKYIFEVGGSSKTFAQIADLPNSYLAIDDIEIGNGNRIPLWMFGFLY
ncbi:MAG: ATP-binding protein [Paludibacteraceae bacterium]|nr:ATP-binding protein [Paludibacteraceae bacterium]